MAESTIQAAIEAHRTAVAIDTKVAARPFEPGVLDAAIRASEAAVDEAFRALVAMFCLTLAEVRQKADYFAHGCGIVHRQLATDLVAEDDLPGGHGSLLHVFVRSLLGVQTTDDADADEVASRSVEGERHRESA